MNKTENIWSKNESIGETFVVFLLFLLRISPGWTGGIGFSPKTSRLNLTQFLQISCSDKPSTRTETYFYWIYSVAWIHGNKVLCLCINNRLIDYLQKKTKSTVWLKRHFLPSLRKYVYLISTSDEQNSVKITFLSKNV